jgi:capsular exopolysaccharide synthesis family protein
MTTDPVQMTQVPSAAANGRPVIASPPMPPEVSVDIERILALGRRRWWVVILAAIVIGAAAYLYSSSQTKKYTATAEIAFQQSSNSTQIIAGLGSTPNQTPDPESNVKQVQFGATAAKTAAQVGHNLTERDVRKLLSVSVAGGTTQFVSVAATSPSPALATQIANTYSKIFVTTAQTADQKYYSHALAIVTKQLAQMTPGQRQTSAGLSLQARVQSLGLLAELRPNNVQLAQVANVPTSPSSPRTKRNTALGIFIGLVVGILLVFALARLDKVVRDPREFEEAYGLPLLGAIPASSQLTRRDEAADGSDRAIPASEAEAFQLVQAHLRYFNVDRDLECLMVTSSTPGDGKTTVSTHLAAAMVRFGSKVLLIEADVRLPTIARGLGIKSDPGLSEVLIGGATMQSTIQSVPVQSPTGEDSSSRRLDVLVAGSITPPNPAALIESQAMHAVLAYGREHYDMVVIDTPPVTAVSDAFSLLNRVDGVIVVGRVGLDRLEVVKRASETLRRTGAPMLGVVANYVNSSNRSNYYYSYGSPAAR